MNYYRLRARKNAPYDSERVNLFLEQDYQAMSHLDARLADDESALQELLDRPLDGNSEDGIVQRLAILTELIL